MPPQTPQSPNPQYDFIFNGGQKPKSGLGLPSFNLPKPVAIALAVVGGLILIVLVSSLLFGGGGNKYQNLVDLANRQQEIIRVTKEFQSQLKDPQTADLAATTSASVTSDQTRLISYLGSKGTKVDTAKLTKDLSTATDSQLKTAAQNNQLDGTYRTYIKAALTTYQSDLNTVYQTAPASAKNLLSSFYSSVGTLLSEEPLST